MVPASGGVDRTHVDSDLINLNHEIKSIFVKEVVGGSRSYGAGLLRSCYKFREQEDGFMVLHYLGGHINYPSNKMEVPRNMLA